MAQREPKPRNPDNNQNHATYRLVYGSPDVVKIVERSGLDVNTYASKEFVMNEGLWDLMEIFSDGELRLASPDTLHDLEQLRNPEAYRSEFYEKITRLRANARNEDGELHDEFNKLARACGGMLAEFVENGQLGVPESATTIPDISAVDKKTRVKFGDYLWESPHEVPIVLEYGPGVSGKKFLDQQLHGLARNIPPFQYIGISNGPFINQFLTSYLQKRLVRNFGQAAGEYATNGRLFVGREDGMLQATQGLIKTPQPSGTHEMSDLILMTGVHKADRRELEKTIKLSSQILRPQGKLMLAAPLTSVEGGSVPFRDQLQWAQEAGFMAEWQKDVQTGSELLGTSTVSGLAVLHK